MKNRIRLLIADDSHFVRESLRNLIAKEPAMELVAEAKDGDEAMDLIEQHRPDVVLLDISMGKPDAGFEVARRLRRMKPPVKVMFMTGQDYSEALLRDFVHRAMELNAEGFIVKTSSSAEITDAIKDVAEGRRHFSGRLTPYLLDLRDRAVAIEPQYPNLSKLSDLDYHILLLLADAKTSKEIAAELGLSPRTIENHMTEMRDKLELKGHHYLMKFAIEHKTELVAIVSSRK